MKKESIFLLLLGLSSLPYAKAQQVIHVDVSNSTGIENGTPAHPFNTILEGLQLSQSGDSVAVSSGTYQEDTLLVEKCVSVSGEGRTATTVEGTFILSSKLDTLPVLIHNLWCRNVLHNDSGYTQTPLVIRDCGLQVLNDHTPSVSETGRILLENSLVTDSIYISSTICAAKREVINCESGGNLWVSCTSSQGTIRIADNTVNGCLRVSIVSKSDTVFITGNTVSDSLVSVSIASEPDVVSNNHVGTGIRVKAIAHNGLYLSGNQIQNGSLTASYKAIVEAVIMDNVILNGGIDFNVVSGDILIKGNEIHSEGTEHGIRLKSTAGGTLENNTIILPYSEPSGLPIPEDTLSVCGIRVDSRSFGGMRGNRISGGAFGVYLSAIVSNDFNNNELEDAHYGLYLRTVSGNVDSNRVEYCLGDGMILDYQPEYDDTNAIYLNHNTIRNNGGHGIRMTGNGLMGDLKEPGTGYNMIMKNGGYDLYVETLPSFVDTIWAQNNQWTHATEDEVGLYDIYDAADDPSKALVIFKPLAPSGTADFLADELAVYPNPTAGKFKVQSTKSKVAVGVQRVEVVDITGRLLEKWNTEHGTWNWTSATCPTGSISSGFILKIK